jgi:hypothetical protein
MTFKYLLKDDGISEANRINRELLRWDDPDCLWIEIKVSDLIIAGILLVLAGIAAGIVLSNL